MSNPNLNEMKTWLKGVAATLLTAMVIGIVGNLYAQTTQTRRDLRTHELLPSHNGVEVELRHINQDIQELKESQRRIEEGQQRLEDLILQGQ